MNIIDTLIGNNTINSLCKLLIFIVVIINLSNIYKGYFKGTKYFVLWIMITLYSVFYSPLDSDNYSSLVNFYAYRDGIQEEYLHFEPIYFRIMDLVPYSYVAWRFLIWGVGSLLLVLYIKWMKFDISVSTVSILYFSLPLLFYQRAIIGYVLIYCGIAFLTKSVLDKKIKIFNPKNLILAIACFLGALPFHTTIIFYIYVAISSIIIVLLFPKRHVFFLLIVLFIFSIRYLPNLINTFIENSSEETQNTAINYLENAKLGAAPNALGYIAYFVTYAPYYGMLIYCVLKISDKILSFTFFEKTVLINSFILVLTSIIFSFLSVSIQGKFYAASLLPWGLFISSFYSRKKESKVAKVFLKASIVSFILTEGIRLTSSLFGSFI